MNLLLYRAGQSNRIVAASHNDVHGARCILRLWNIKRDARVCVQRILLHPANHADNSDPRRIRLANASEMQALANRVLVWPELLRHVVVDYRHMGFVGNIILGE